MASHPSLGDTSTTSKPMLLLMDSPRKQDARRGPWATSGDRCEEDDDDGSSHKPVVEKTQQIRSVSLVGSAADVVRVTSQPPESLGRLLVEMTAQVQDERARRSDVEKKNQSLLLEIEQLQKELLELKTSREQQTRRRASEDWDAATRTDHERAMDEEGLPLEGNTEFWWRELQEAKHTKDVALAEAHRRALEVIELQACISMQHDELKALRASEADVRFTLSQTEERCKEMQQQHTIVLQENQLLKDEVAHLNGEIGKRGAHFKALMDKWSEAQAQCEHVERENRAMLDKMKDLRAKHEQLQRETEQARDERDLLQHQANHLKGAVAAKAAEAKAFQAYGTNARDHLQAQQAMIQRHTIYRRKVHHVARDSAVLVKSIKTTLASVRAPLVAIQHDFKTFLKHLQTPVMSLVQRSKRYAEVAHIEHTPLRAALADAELTRRHLHEQLWRSRRNALLVCQIRNLSTSISTAESILGSGPPTGDAGTVAKRTLRANYGTAELLLRESERDTVTVKCDAVFSDRARGNGCWNSHESVVPLLQSVLDGYNACVATFDGLPSLQQPDASSPSAASETVGVPELVLTQLYEMLHRGGAHFHRVKLTVSFLGVYNEAIYDLLGLDPHGVDPATPATAPSMSKIVVLEVQNAEEALLVLRGGCENLDAAHDLKLLDKFLTHKVITVCVSHENLLLNSTTGSTTTKSKLQIVELATGPGDSDAAVDVSWEDRGRVKAHVAMDNGVQALLTTLADVRVVGDATAGTASASSASASGAFVRYHSSKLTVLLQDTVKPRAKFLVVAALPGAVASSSGTPSPALDTRAAQATRWLFHIRTAVGGTSVTANSSTTHGPADRSVEGFINRFTSQQSHAESGAAARNGSSLAFTCADAVERPPLESNGDARRWEKELDQMHRRYGDLNKFTTSFYQPSIVSTDPVAHRRRSYDDDNGPTATISAASPRRQTTAVVSVDQLTDVVVHPGELLSIGEDADVHPPPAPVKSGRAKSKTGSKVYRGLPGHRNGSKTHSRSHVTLGSDKPKRRVTTAATSSDPTPTTLAPRASSPPRATSMVKLRRETASSALKKVLAATSAAAAKPRPHASSTTHHHAATLATGTPASAATMTATSATQARLQNRKIPFK